MVTPLAYFAFGGQRTQDIVDIATAIELIHTATLLHDDIIDGAENAARQRIRIQEIRPEVHVGRGRLSLHQGF